MRDFPFSIVGFDLDGTLVDSAGDLAAAVNHALAVAGRDPVSVERVRTMIGGGARTMLPAALRATGGDEQLDDLLPVLLDHYDRHIAVSTRPFPGVIDALDRLAALGITLAVVTNKREHFTAKLLDALDLTRHFACVISGDTPGLTAMKPDPAPVRLMLERCGGGRAAFVGDSNYDVGTARAAGVPIILFSADDDDLGADARIADYADLIPALHRIASSQAA